MTIEQANQYFAALPDGFASTEQLRAAFTAPVQKVQFVGVAGTAGKTVTARGHPARTGDPCRPVPCRVPPAVGAHLHR
jgi:hypothetical protein